METTCAATQNFAMPKSTEIQDRTPLWLRLLAGESAILCATVASVVLFGLLSRWTYEQWQVVDWAIVVGGILLTAFFLGLSKGDALGGDDFAIVWAPLVTSAIVLGGLTIFRYDRFWWTLLALAAAAVFAGAALILIILAILRDEEPAIPPGSPPSDS